MSNNKQKSTKTHKDEKDRSEFYSLDSLDYSIIDLMLRNPSINDTEIAKQLGYKREQINKRKNRPAFKKEIIELSKEAITKIQEIQSKAVRRLEKIIEFGEDKDAKTAAIALLDGLPEKASGINNKDPQKKLIIVDDE